MKGNTPTLPEKYPKAGEIYKHYKGDNYKVFDLAIDSVADEWSVIYEAMYEQNAAKYFVRALTSWNEVVEWNGAQVDRFTLVK